MSLVDDDDDEEEGTIMAPRLKVLAVHVRRNAPLLAAATKEERRGAIIMLAVVFAGQLRRFIFGETDVSELRDWERQRKGDKDEDDVLLKECPPD